VRLVLHGAGRFTKRHSRSALGHGFQKLVMKNEYLKVQPNGITNIAGDIEEGTRAVQETIEICIDMLGFATMA